MLLRTKVNLGVTNLLGRYTLCRGYGGVMPHAKNDTASEEQMMNKI